MIKIDLKEETRVEIYFFLGLLLLLFVMILLNFFFGKNGEDQIVKKDKEKTVIVTEAKKDTGSPKAPSKTIVGSVSDVIKHADYSTAYMEINRVPKNSPEYEELSKILAGENLKRKAPNIRKDTGGQIRYLDESTPRNRETDALYMYFVDISGTLWPRFCIQNAAKRPLGIIGFIITADSKNIKIDAPSVKFENIEKGVAEWYDVPLDKLTYGAVQAIVKAKKVTLTIIGSRGKANRDVTDSEIKGIRHILDGFAALGGNLNYMQDSKPLLPAQNNR